MDKFTHIHVERDPGPVSSTWTNPGIAGFLVDIFSEKDPRPAKEQVAENYAHGGGWNPMPEFTLWHTEEPGSGRLTFPGDPPFRERSRAHLPLTGETLILFDYGFVAIVQADGSFEAARMD